MPLVPPTLRTAIKRGALAAAALAVGAASAHAQSGRLAQADFDAQALDRVAFQTDDQTPLFLAGPLRAADGAAPAEAAADFLSDNAAAFGFERAPDVEVQRTQTDALGKTHVYVRQTVGGVPVFGAQSALHLDADGSAYAWGGTVHPRAERVDVNAAISASAAIGAARASLDPATVYRADSAPDLLGGEAMTWAPTAELVVYPTDDGDYRLAYHVELFVDAPMPANWNVFVDARTGEAFHRFNGIHTFDPAHERAAAAPMAPLTGFATTLDGAVAALMDGPTTGTGTSLYEGTYSLPTYLYEGNYYLYDVTRGPSYIRTMTGNNGYSLPGSYVTDSNNNFSSQSQKAAVDAHYGAVETFDYFKDTHGRSSYNGNNATITSTVNHQNNYNNAFWNGQQMVYGDGDGYTFSPLVELDIVAHELTHAVTNTSANLIYQNESGALNEAVSDIFAIMVDRNDYKVGEQSYTPGTPGDALRYMDNPPAGNQPDHYDDRYTGSGDNGGVHINSGIANKQAYLMIAGGTFNGVSVQSVGRSVTEKVWYRALTSYFTQSTNFSGARQGTLQAAADLYGNGSSQYNAVANAWAAVGVGSAASGGGGGGGTGTPEWRYETLTIESPHNYPNNYNNTKTYSKPGAQKVAMYFQNFSTENNYDYVYIKDGNNVTRASYTGNRAAFWAVVDGSTIKANLVSDYSITAYGYRVTTVAYYSDQALFAADPNPVLGFVPEAPASDPVVELGKAGEVTELALSAAPNPTRGATRISASLPEAGALRVAVLDLLGREVAVLADGNHEAGVHELALDTSDLPAGVYVVALEAGAERLTERVTVLR